MHMPSPVSVHLPEVYITQYAVRHQHICNMVQIYCQHLLSFGALRQTLETQNHRLTQQAPKNKIPLAPTWVVET